MASYLLQIIFPSDESWLRYIGRSGYIMPFLQVLQYKAECLQGMMATGNQIILNARFYIWV
jgi:hypothetical protein